MTRGDGGSLPRVGPVLAHRAKRKSDQSVTFVRFIIWLAIGLVVYFLYSRHHSQLEAGDAAAGQ